MQNANNNEKKGCLQDYKYLSKLWTLSQIEFDGYQKDYKWLSSFESVRPASDHIENYGFRWELKRQKKLIHENIYVWRHTPVLMNSYWCWCNWRNFNTPDPKMLKKIESIISKSGSRNMLETQSSKKN
jgi:hypothetical protein